MFKFFSYLYKDYKRKAILEEPKYIFDKNTQFILFSGTSLCEDGDIRHLNDLCFVLYILKYYNIDSNNIVLSIDIDILEEFDRTHYYKAIKNWIKNSVGNIIDVQNFENEYERPSDKNIVFVASGHGDINGLSISKNNTFITSDFFEKIALEKKSTLIIMSQCFAGAFHHLDTRKNICVMGASEYQKSLSIPIKKLVCHYKINEDLRKFLLHGLAFNPGISINPFLFAFVIITIEPNIFIKSDKKHLINIYKSTAALTLEYMENTYHILTLKEDRNLENEYVFDGIRITQQPYLLNKILAARYSINK